MCYAPFYAKNRCKTSPATNGSKAMSVGFWFTFPKITSLYGVRMSFAFLTASVYRNRFVESAYPPVRCFRSAK